MHDYGHSSILASPKYNKYIQFFFLGFIKGGSVDWWNHMHNQHHAKPNVINKDPDSRMDPIFVLGKHQPIRVIQIKNFNRFRIFIKIKFY
jgi:fatty acid desaturase